MSNHSILTQSKTVYNEAKQQLLFLPFYLKMWTIFTSSQDGDKEGAETVIFKCTEGTQEVHIMLL